MRFINTTTMGVLLEVDTTTPPTFSPSETNKRLLIGVTLSVMGNLLISVAMNVQKYSHNQLIDSNKSYIRSFTWWVGLLLMILGEIGNFTAYGFAPASLVAPLGTTSVIANAAIAAFFLKEEIRARDILGITLSIVGAFLLVNFSKKSDNWLSGDEILSNFKQYAFIIYLCILVCLFVFLVYLHHHLNYIKVVTILLQVAILGSLTVISAKAVSSMLSLTFIGFNQLVHPVFYLMLIVMLATAIGQVKVLNQAMQAFDTTVVMPTNFVFFTLSAILGGIVFYREFYGLTFIEVFMFLFGALLSFVGVFFLTGGRKTDSEDAGGKSDEKEHLLKSEEKGNDVDPEEMQPMCDVVTKDNIINDNNKISIENNIKTNNIKNVNNIEIIKNANNIDIDNSNNASKVTSISNNVANSSDNNNDASFDTGIDVNSHDDSVEDDKR